MGNGGLEEFRRQVHTHWAEHFGCPVERLGQRGVTLMPEERLKRQKLIVLWHIGTHTFVEFDPARAEALQRAINALPAGSLLTGEHLQKAWPAAITERDIGLIHHLYPPELPTWAPAATFAVRQLLPDDEGAMHALHEANTPEDVDEGFVEVSHEIVFGCFAGQQLVAAASGYRRNGFMDIGVLTHPGFRRQGLGKAVVGRLCEWCITHGWLAQYRCNAQNTASQGVARSLGFRLFFRSESIWLA